MDSSILAITCMSFILSFIFALGGVGSAVVLIPASEIADEVGTPKVSNVVILGAMVAATDAFTPEFCEDTLRAIIKKKSLIDMNMKAFRRGYDFVKNS